MLAHAMKETIVSDPKHYDFTPEQVKAYDTHGWLVAKAWAVGVAIAFSLLFIFRYFVPSALEHFGVFGAGVALGVSGIILYLLGRLFLRLLSRARSNKPDNQP